MERGAHEMDDGGVDGLGGGTRERRNYAGKLSKRGQKQTRCSCLLAYVLAVRLQVVDISQITTWPVTYDRILRPTAS
jgi:hypothetical protein